MWVILMRWGGGVSVSKTLWDFGKIEIIDSRQL
jgi:hypothetical protein